MSDTGDSIIAENANWSFGGEVSKKFDSHVSKSVPFYHEGHDLVCKIADYFLPSNSLCYELGCSTAKLTHELALRNKGKDVDFIGVDSVPEMLEQGRTRCQNQPNVTLVQGDLTDFEFQPADTIISYYTIQFVKPRHRQDLIHQIYQSLNWGGAFIWFEKVRAPDARFQDMMTGIYSDYKLDQGYNSEEIIAKSRSLKGVLEPFSTQGNIDLLKRAGFKDIMTVMKYVCFEGFVAIK